MVKTTPTTNYNLERTAMDRICVTPYINPLIKPITELQTAIYCAFIFLSIETPHCYG
ncbi:hypothetical protein J6590_057470 [Homalodisca vitripennis]|nr:hypothetical protein J6590_057470 [Homalodisca vitripennis]